MQTKCPDCGAELIFRSWQSQDPPRFIEAHRCGEVAFWGANPEVLIPCPHKKPDPAKEEE